MNSDANNIKSTLINNVPNLIKSHIDTTTKHFLEKRDAVRCNREKSRMLCRETSKRVRRRRSVILVRKVSKL